MSDKCSTKTTATNYQNMFHDVLRLNGYPESTVDKTKHSQNHQNDPRTLNTERSYLKISYISKRLNYKITNIFRKQGIPARIAHKSYTLRRALRRVIFCCPLPYVSAIHTYIYIHKRLCQIFGRRISMYFLNVGF